jgi:hypothetical protein
MLGALLKVAFGLLPLVVEAKMILWFALSGDGWLQTSVPAVGYRVWWAFMVWLSLFLLHRGIRGIRAARR